MGRRTGTADLPLHGGRVPEWLASRMSALGRVIVEALVVEFGRDEVLRRLSHPFWFQSLGCVMGMDWHSSGITTSVLGALKRGLGPVSDELGIWVCGGRGRHSRRTPEELLALSERTGLDGRALVWASRLSAKVDSAAVQDGFDLYLHGFVVTAEGRWTVVQQGMDPDSGLARRYHWLAEGLESFVEAPHSAIEGESVGDIVNLTDRRAAPARGTQLELIQEGPDKVVELFRRASGRPEERQPVLPHLRMPDHHEVRPSDVHLRRLHGAIAAAEAASPASFEDLLLAPKIGARTVRALALVSEVVYGAPSRFSDPARFAFAHGGKDGHPFPVPLKVYDRTLRTWIRAVTAARLGQSDRLSALRRLDAEVRRLERHATGAPFEELVQEERNRSHEYGGRSVFGRAKPPVRSSPKPLPLFAARKGR